MAPIRMKTKTEGPLSPGTSATGAARLNPVVAAAAKAIEDKYDRPANLERYFDRTRKYNEGLRAGGEEFRDDSGILRLNLVNKGITDPNTGATILSMMRPELTAVAPRNFGEFMRDVGGAAGDTLGAVGEKVLSGGVTADLLNFVKEKYEGSKQKLNRFLNPPDEQLNQNLEGILEDAGASNNPLFNNMSFEPIRVSEMDPSNLTAEASGIENVFNRIKQLQDFGSQYGLDGIQVDPFNLNKGIGYQNQFMFNDMPIDYGFNIAPGGNFGFNLGLQY